MQLATCVVPECEISTQESCHNNNNNSIAPPLTILRKQRRLVILGIHLIKAEENGEQDRKRIIWNGVGQGVSALKQPSIVFLDPIHYIAFCQNLFSVSQITDYHVRTTLNKCTSGGAVCLLNSVQFRPLSQDPVLYRVRYGSSTVGCNYEQL